MKLETIKEQVKNKELKWSYRAYLISLYHHIMQAKEGKAPCGRYSKGWGIRDTAKDLAMSTGSVSNYLKLDEAIAKKPELKVLSIKKALEKL